MAKCLVGVNHFLLELARMKAQLKLLLVLIEVFISPPAIVDVLGYMMTSCISLSSFFGRLRELWM